MTETHRCCGKLRGFRGGQCDHRGTIEHNGRWYCGKHDPRPVTLEGEAKYVWEVWNHHLFHTPQVTRYRLVKLNEKGGATVLKNGYPHVLKLASDKKYFTSEAELYAHLAKWHAAALERARRDVAKLEAAAADPLRGIVVEEVRDTPYNLSKKLKTE